MISIDEARERVLAAARPGQPELVPLSDALDRTLSEDVAADVDSPPHDKATVDGYAVRSADFARRPRGDVVEPVELAVVEEVVAGQVPTVPLTAGRATRIMTGAPLPVGADAVVMFERTRAEPLAGVPGGVIRCDEMQVAAGLNVMPRAASFRRGQVLLSAGAVLRPIEIGLLAEVGRRDVRVFARPRVAVLPTGNELVDAAFTPAAGQIRNTNGPLLLAAVRRHGGVPLDLGIGRDDRGHLRERIAAGLVADVLVLSGGVSAGVLDLVPEVLGDLGVKEIFHGVAVRPGKPIWFGVGGGPSDRTLVFGLPGNPVSSLVSFELFVAPALARLAGRPATAAPTVRARLACEFQHRGPRTTYHPARLRNEGPNAIVETVPWQGSGDLRTLADANAWAIFPAGDKHYAAGEEIECRLL